MRFFKNIFLIALTLTLALSCESNSQSSKDLTIETQMDSVSYSIGANIGRSFKADNLDLNPQLVLQGMIDKMKDSTTILTDEQMSQVMASFQQLMQEKKQKDFLAKSQANTAKGQEFLDKNKSAEGVQVTESGLQHKVLKEGTGKSPNAKDTVKVHYHGTLLDGTVFDSSVERGEPIEFPLNRVIPGWTEGLQLMKEGGKSILYIPSELAYGARGQGETIGPNETLIFEVELLEVKPAN